MECERCRRLEEAGAALRKRLHHRGHSRSCHIYPAGGACTCGYDAECLAWDRAVKALAHSAPERQVARRCRHCGETNGWLENGVLMLTAHADCIAKANEPAPAPRYDEVYFAGVARMDAQARGEAFDPLTDEEPAPGVCPAAPEPLVSIETTHGPRWIAAPEPAPACRCGEGEMCPTYPDCGGRPAPAPRVIKPVPAPTERVCLCSAPNKVGAPCEEYVEREGYQGCFICGHDRACHTEGR